MAKTKFQTKQNFKLSVKSMHIVKTQHNTPVHGQNQVSGQAKFQVVSQTVITDKVYAYR